MYSRSSWNWNITPPLPRLETFRLTPEPTGNLLTPQTSSTVGGTLTQDGNIISRVLYTLHCGIQDSRPLNIKIATTLRGPAARDRSKEGISVVASAFSRNSNMQVSHRCCCLLCSAGLSRLTFSAFNRRCSCLSSSWCAIVSLSSACAACHAPPPHENRRRKTIG